tara:strand:+ start:2515 stop:2724 length:210 start_codon:yes stop_codon:yes gene_type:complete
MEVCKYYLNGNCKKGNKCKWVHIKRWDFMKPKSPIAIKNEIKINKFIETRPVIINGNWADVKDSDPFFD